jgi:Fe-S cluster assembly protein SufD
MSSKRITPSQAVAVHVAASETDIEVPAGHFRYLIQQAPTEQRAHTFHLRHPGSSISVVGFVNAQGSDAPSLDTTVVHHAAQTSAETLIKTLARNQAAPQFRGLIRIEEGSHSCESYLNHHSLLIGNEAQSYTVPCLEILNNEVKCSHAATVKTITPLDLFYLQSRGLAAAEAEATLIEAFLSDAQS